MAASPPLRHVAMLPFMAKGHAMPLLHLARLLLSRGLASAVTFFTTPRNVPFIRAGLAGATAAAVVELPFPCGSDESAPQSMDELPSSAYLVDFLSAISALRPGFLAALASVEPKPDLLVHDGFLLWATDVADELAVPRLVTLGMGGFASYVCRAMMEHRPHAGLRSPSEPFAIPGLPPALRFTRAEFTPPFDDPEPSGPHWEFVSESCRRMYSSRGIIANSFDELDAAYIDLWNREFDTKMWAIGPLCRAASETSLDRDIAGWLDGRLAMGRPVLYVAFGSQAELSRAQLEEIAVGLDGSGLDFLWVVRSKWFTDAENDDRFVDRFGDRGKVVEGFIDQLGVLSHESVRGFFTHCGWNSVLESISMGVPILAFPMAAEQELNAKFVVDVVHVGLRVCPKGSGVDKEGAIVSGDVEVSTRMLIFGEEGKRAAARASELSVSSRKALEVGGSSFENLDRMVREISETDGKTE